MGQLNPAADSSLLSFIRRGLSKMKSTVYNGRMFEGEVNLLHGEGYVSTRDGDHHS